MGQRTTHCEICGYNIFWSEILIYILFSMVHFNRPQSAVGNEELAKWLNFWE